MNNKFKFAASVLVLFASCTKPSEVLVSEPQPTLSVMSTPISSVTENSFVKKWDFEGTTPYEGLSLEKAKLLDPTTGLETTTEIANSIEVVPDPINNSNKVLKCSMPVNCCRAEVSLVNSNSQLIYAYKGVPAGVNIAANTNVGNEVWIKAKIYVPNNLTTQSTRNTTANLNTCMVQLGPISKAGQSGSNGFFQLRATPSSANTIGLNNSDWKAFTSSIYNISTYNGSQPVGVIQTGQWLTYILHCKFGSATNENDLLEARYYISNNSLISSASCSQVQAQLDTRIRIKWGLYIGMGNPSIKALTCYYDDVTVKSGSSTFSEMLVQ